MAGQAGERGVGGAQQWQGPGLEDIGECVAGWSLCIAAHLLVRAVETGSMKAVLQLHHRDIGPAPGVRVWLPIAPAGCFVMFPACLLLAAMQITFMRSNQHSKERQGVWDVSKLPGPDSPLHKPLVSLVQGDEKVCVLLQRACAWLQPQQSAVYPLPEPLGLSQRHFVAT